MANPIQLDEQAYLKERVEDQQDWFERKSSWNQKRYKRLNFHRNSLHLFGNTFHEWHIETQGSQSVGNEVMLKYIAIGY